MNIIFTVTEVAGASAILYLLAMTLGFPITITTIFVSIPPLLTLKLYESLEVKSAKRALAEVGLNSMASLEEFLIHPFFVFLLALVMVSGMLFFTGALMGLLVEFSAEAANHVSLLESQQKLFSKLVVSTSWPLRIVASAYIGYWIGTRSRRYYGLAIVIGSFVIGSCVTFLLSFLILINDEMFTAITGEGKTISVMMAQFVSVLSDMVIFVISGIFGFWSGRRHRLARYLEFITSILSQETRQTIVEMARDEAIRAHRAPGVQAA